METYPLPGHPCGCGLAGGGAEGERCDFYGFEVIMDGLTDKCTDGQTEFPLVKTHRQKLSLPQGSSECLGRCSSAR